MFNLVLIDKYQKYCNEIFTMFKKRLYQHSTYYQMKHKINFFSFLYNFFLNYFFNLCKLLNYLKIQVVI